MAPSKGKKMPRVNGLASKVVSLTRRKEFLEAQINEGRGSASSLAFARAEAEALDSAIVCLHYHRAVIEGLDQPIGIIKELVSEYATERGVEGSTIARARLLLTMYDA